MTVCQSIAPDAIGEIVARYQTVGFFILRGLFSGAEMQALAAEADRLLTERADLISPKNLRCRYMPHCETGEQLFEVFDPVNDISPMCERFSKDRRILDVLDAIYGEPPVLFKDKLIFKPPGAMGYRLHQDIPLAWKGFPKSFLTVLIPIDSCSIDNGCTEVFRGYHHSHLSNEPDNYMLPDDVVDPERRVRLEMEPGDVAIFHGLTPHRSDPNRSNTWRRTLYTSYNALSEGGDQRAAHYAEFQQKMCKRLVDSGTEGVYFK
jgi:hypothetical protein